MSEQLSGQDDGGVRGEKMIQLAFTPPAKLEEAVSKWPKWQEMPEDRKKAFLAQIDEFRQNLRKFAMSEAARMKLVIAPEREEEYVRAFWTKRMEVERTLRKEIEPRRKELLETAEASLQKQFGPKPETVKISAKTD
jgi:hypothetical protein